MDTAPKVEDKKVETRPVTPRQADILSELETNGGLTVTQLVEALGMRSDPIREHLLILRGQGLVVSDGGIPARWSRDPAVAYEVRSRTKAADDRALKRKYG